MTGIELQEQQDESQGDLRDQIYGVRLEVEKVRTAMASQFGGLGMRVFERVGEVEMRLAVRISGVEENPRGGQDGHRDVHPRRLDRFDGGAELSRGVEINPPFAGWGRVLSSTVGAEDGGW